MGCLAAPRGQPARRGEPGAGRRDPARTRPASAARVRRGGLRQRPLRVRRPAGAARRRFPPARAKHDGPGGTVGGGKTTVARLLARFWDTDAGTVLIGGVDVRDIAPADLMARVAFVFQDVYLFDGTLADNIRLGRADATDDEVRDAATTAGLDDVLADLPSGLDTPVGEGGTALSGGQRQRVSIARALLKRAPIVVLDEATAALDPEADAAVRTAVAACPDRPPCW
ncbi:ABC transporter ATP-binding protein [Micromonospora sp. b486]|uniref:ATP-binding cassette domain-containing protein n=1 Tax=Micromonospora sp. b486 TaxID=3053986 RepID=UPI00259C7B60|nr:ABC transporter ATP-binding protein [Micromonospora sp. b486]MDM4778161.1 ABC transporter ATP-binding protein [Micromonospora sp. b486]